MLALALRRFDSEGVAFGDKDADTKPELESLSVRRSTVCEELCDCDSEPLSDTLNVSVTEGLAETPAVWDNDIDELRDARGDWLAVVVMLVESDRDVDAAPVGDDERVCDCDVVYVGDIDDSRLTVGDQVLLEVGVKDNSLVTVGTLSDSERLHDAVQDRVEDSDIDALTPTVSVVVKLNDVVDECSRVLDLSVTVFDVDAVFVAPLSRPTRFELTVSADTKNTRWLFTIAGLDGDSIFASEVE